MRYMLLIYTNEKTDLQPGQEGFDEMMAGYGAFTQEIMASGQFHAGDPLLPAVTAKTTRVREGKTLVTDGPFAETTEQLGGYYIVNCASIDEAAALAAKIPGASRGCVEVREVAEMTGS